jgi:quercetin dioxygenase-like cupin family protein
LIIETEETVKITKLDRVKKIKVEMDDARNVYKQVPIGVADGAPNFVFRVFTMRPEGQTPFHSHAFEHINYIISGRGALVDKDGLEHPVEQGDFCMVMPDEKHRYRNASDKEDFVMICAVPRQYE